MHEYCYFKFGYLKWMINLNLYVSLSRDHRAKSEICIELLSLCVFVIFSSCKLLHLSSDWVKVIFGETLKIQSFFKTSTDKFLISIPLGVIEIGHGFKQGGCSILKMACVYQCVCLSLSVARLESLVRPLAWIAVFTTKKIAIVKRITRHSGGE